MAVAALPDRRRFREHPLDGALLYFHPETGTSVHVRTEATRQFRRRAPRVVMFGITNACNLRCVFCSRDAATPSLWSVDAAAEVLEGLAEAGVLEVAFGGGEPFAFRGFDQLLLRLYATTALALHVTTNGELATSYTLACLAGVVGQVRLSLYDGRPWRDAACRFAGEGIRWGANVLVDDAALEGLPSILDEVTALGARDVSLLSYVGPDVGRHLSPAGEERLAAIVRGSPLPCRVSVCFGDRVPVPRLFDGADDSGDCGAG
jgi:MoaA/NifB/PqqE/SkfB family radical SAM enzyme